MNPRLTLLINGLCALLLGWLYGGDALDALRSQSAEVSAYLEPPNLVFALGALLATGVGLGASGLGLAQQRPKTWRGYRLMPIVTVVVLFVDLFLFSAARSPLSSSDRAALTVQSLAEAATTAATATAVPSSPRELQGMAEQFGAPPYLVNGAPVKAWSVSVRQRCSGPVTEVKGEPVGTLFYCLAEDGRQAWISAVGLPVGTYFGAPALFSRGGEPVVGVVQLRPEEEPAEGAPEGEVPPPAPEHPRPSPSWFETPDSGR
ncbi:MAG: hypothetical protein H6Q89_3252 [Myxococcaceae bacterium]|nr:hypothetical protein [Myxococcaceae bacterium]